LVKESNIHVVFHASNLKPLHGDVDSKGWPYLFLLLQISQKFYQ